MSENLVIPVDRLRAVFEVLMAHLTEVRGSTVEVGTDYYWSIDPEKVYNPWETPKADELTLGRIPDEWEWLEETLADPERALGYHLVWLGELLKAIGHETKR